MATGYFSEGVCWALAQEAIDAHFQSIPPTVLTSASETYYNFYQKQSPTVWNAVKQTRSSAGVLTTDYSLTEDNPVFLECELPNDPLTQFQDGITLGWGVATVIIVVYLIARVTRGRT